MTALRITYVRVDHLTPAQVRAYAIADNRLAELASWDRKRYNHERPHQALNMRNPAECYAPSTRSYAGLPDIE